ncbi:hypothetical protein [uncultured Modestobacter sp.]|uniref:hypothetical protein n=1 Tax=uncultured Modestobacter sp. TaxID=380048 RepID=UPI00260EAFBD|nr:hypothetical protein [uncultured Modestobacter sp.]
MASELPDLHPTDGGALVPPPSGRAVLLAAVARPAASAALRLAGQQGWLVPWNGDDVLVLGDLPAMVAVAAVVSETAAGPVGVVLWADPDDDRELDEGEVPEPAAGLVVCHRGSPVAGHTWTATEHDEPGDAHLIAELTGRPDREVGLRALLRRTAPDPVVLLPELTALLDLPPGPLALLSPDLSPPGTVHVPAVTGLRRAGAFRDVLADVPEPAWAGPARRWQFLLPAIVAGYFAVRSAAAGVTAGPVEDVWGYGTLSVVATTAAVWRARRDRRRADRD